MVIRKKDIKQRKTYQFVPGATIQINVKSIRWLSRYNFSLCDLALIDRVGDLYGRLCRQSRNDPSSYQIAPVPSTV